jgi:hypothetical protein
MTGGISLTGGSLQGRRSESADRWETGNRFSLYSGIVLVFVLCGSWMMALKHIALAWTQPAKLWQGFISLFASISQHYAILHMRLKMLWQVLFMFTS